MRFWNIVLTVALSLSFGQVSFCEDGPKEKSEKEATKDSAKGKKPSEKKPLSKEEQSYELYKLFADTLDEIDRNYVKEVDRRELMEAAIRGMLTKLDPYSNYISPEDIASFRTNVESQFGGIGIQIANDDGHIRILSPLVGSPAYRAGIQAGDLITHIEGESTADLHLDEAIKKLKGETGTTVSFTVLHPATKKSEKLTLKREIIHVPTVLGDTHKKNDDWDFMYDRDKKIAYIRITSFSRDTTTELKKALIELDEKKMKGLVLDLRNNPGGLLTTAVEVSDLFLTSGKIVSTKGRNTKEKVWKAKKEGTYEGFPMAVLVNRYSASASEILSAALQDHGRAVIVGERSWGKGSVQNVIDLEDGKSALKLTTAGYMRPNGHNIHRFPDSKESDEWGVKPNDGFDLKFSDAELGHYMSYRRQRDFLQPKQNDVTKKVVSEDEKEPTTKDDAEPKESSEDKNESEKPFVDRQLLKAIEALKLDSDVAKK